MARLFRSEPLPTYEPIFREAAAAQGLNWRLLAAVGYQESHWDPQAVSPTGVRGIMMLTKRTARALGVDREDPAGAIHGAARYLQELLGQLPPDLHPDDRVWFALAAYNLGARHVARAREFAIANHADPNRWDDVARFLPHVDDETANRRPARRGRGRAAVGYVRSVRWALAQLHWHRPD